MGDFAFTIYFLRCCATRSRVATGALPHHQLWRNLILKQQILHKNALVAAPLCVAHL